MIDFDPTEQFRCTIIRGKAKTNLDNLLHKYAIIIQELCPCPKKDFAVSFNDMLRDIIGG